jgi:hypothetical protein
MHSSTRMVFGCINGSCHLFSVWRNDRVDCLGYLSPDLHRFVLGYGPALSRGWLRIPSRQSGPLFPRTQACDHLTGLPCGPTDSAVNLPSGAFVTVTLFGPGPGLNVDFAPFRFHVPVKTVA